MRASIFGHSGPLRQPNVNELASQFSGRRQLVNICDAINPHRLCTQEVFSEHQCDAAGKGTGCDHDLRSLNQKQPQQLKSQDDEAETVPAADISKRIEATPRHIVSVFRIDTRINNVQTIEGWFEPLQLDPMSSSRSDGKYSFAQWQHSSIDRAKANELEFSPIRCGRMRLVI